ncbi:ROK family protein [Hydrogenimonas sp.]
MSRLAVDVGGTHLRYELVGEKEEACGSVSSRDTEPARFIESMLERYPDIDAVAISFAGQVNEGTIVAAPNIEVAVTDIRNHFESRYGIRLRIENDLNCAALAESVYWGEKDLVAIYSGTGLGSGIVEKGEICHGWRNLAGEIGHVPYREAPFSCGCGKNNCLELYASGSGLRKWMEYRGCDGDPDLGKLFRSPDGRCREIAERYVTALLYGIGTIATLLNPKMIVLGGGVVQHSLFLKERVEREIGKFALNVSLEGMKIETTRIENASLEGAKLLLDTM